MASKMLQPAHSLFFAPQALSPQLPISPQGALDRVTYVKNPLNEGQRLAVEDSFAKRVALLWGPPGTGKTDTLAAAVCAWLEAAQAKGVSLAVCLGAANYAALDHLLKGILQLLQRRLESTGALPVVLHRVRSTSSDSCDIPGVVDVPRAQNPTPAAAELVGRLQGSSGLTLVAGTYLQMQRLARQANAERRGVEGAVGAPWFDLVVLDEASQMPTSSALCYACLLKPHGHLLVAGDNKQLGPVYTYQVEESRSGLLDCVYAFFLEHHHIEPARLSQNYRTNQDIAAWPSVRFYEEKYSAVHHDRALRLGPDVSRPSEWPGTLPFSDAWSHLLDPDAPITVLVHPENTSTVSNAFEARAVACLARAYWHRLKQIEPGLTKSEFWSERLGLVTPHRAQIATIRNLLGDLAPGESEPGAILVDTVDRFQGQERDLIIGSYVVSDKDFIAGEEEFILDARRFNVTLTRARAKFVLLLSRALLSYLPAEKKTAESAAHLQLFVEQFCERRGPMNVPAPAGELACELFMKSRTVGAAA
ncbi:MAG TPA: ATP-binding protein [Candidatus Paceibacterota bacterium]|nr:ATP-binding protein [Candidatus Paceibacterota bacterium]